MRYGEVRLEELDVGEGEAVPIEGDALQWALGLRQAAASSRRTNSDQDGGGEAAES